MSVEIDPEKGILAYPVGLFDFATGYDCVAKIESHLQALGPVQVTIDFGQTTFMDSSGIGALIALLRSMPTTAPMIKLIHPTKSVQKLMEVCHLHKLFDIESEESSTNPSLR